MFISRNMSEQEQPQEPLIKTDLEWESESFSLSSTNSDEECADLSNLNHNLTVPFMTPKFIPHQWAVSPPQENNFNSRLKLRDSPQELGDESKDLKVKYETTKDLSNNFLLEGDATNFQVHESAGTWNNRIARGSIKRSAQHKTSQLKAESVEPRHPFRKQASSYSESDLEVPVIIQDGTKFELGHRVSPIRGRAEARDHMPRVRLCRQRDLEAA